WMAEADLIVEPQRWTVIDYTSLQGPSASGQMTWVIGRGAVGHGITVWFDATTATGFELSNAPSAEPLVYGQAFFPFPEPVVLSPGDEIHVRLRADLVDEDYVWRWDTTVTDGVSRRVKTAREQSSWLAASADPERLRKR